MATERTFTASGAGPLTVDLTSITGTVSVAVDPATASATVTVRTEDASGPSADAVNSTTFKEDPDERSLLVRVPRPKTVGRASTSASAGRRVHNVISGGSYDSMVIMAGNIGNLNLTRDTVLIDSSGTGRSETEPSPVEVEVRLPQGSSLALTTSKAHLCVTGPLSVLEVTSRAGHVTADAADTVDIITTDGRIEIGAILSKGKIATDSADIELRAYQGSDLSVESRTGDIRLTATSTATGPVELTTVDGSIVTKGAQDLDLTAHSANGVVHHR
ncbi:DUF4097 family beta strand repeat-containing protein [Kitasatospora sp. NPDC088556]|uniref:DUF4097 family beta strand repeat-containing protein n=1 Tax=Kitasatospora sp. NPDC088556 TaxID=3364076 RepID=UPI0037FEF8E8